MTESAFIAPDLAIQVGFIGHIVDRLQRLKPAFSCRDDFIGVRAPDAEFLLRFGCAHQ